MTTQIQLSGEPFDRSRQVGFNTRDRQSNITPTPGAGAGRGEWQGPPASVTVGTSDLPAWVFTGSSIAWADITGGTHRKVVTGHAYNGSMTATVRAVQLRAKGRTQGQDNRQAFAARAQYAMPMHARRGVGSALFGSSEDTSCQAVGFDAPLFESKLEFERWAAGQDRARCGLSDKLLALGQRAAQRQRRRILDLRGVAPSDTSVEDAAADAVLAILTHVRKLHKITAAQWESYRLVESAVHVCGARGVQFVDRVGGAGDAGRESRAIQRARRGPVGHWHGRAR